MKNLNNAEFNATFFVGQRVKCTSPFINKPDEPFYSEGKIFTIESIVKDVPDHIGDDGCPIMVTNVQLAEGGSFSQEFMKKHFEPVQLDLFHSILRRMKKAENDQLYKLEVLEQETDVMSAFFGDQIMLEAKLGDSSNISIAAIKSAIDMTRMGQEYFELLDIAISRWLSHCEYAGALGNVESFSDSIKISLKISESKLIQITEKGIFYGGHTAMHDNCELVCFSIEGAYESQAVGVPYCSEPMPRAIQLSILEYLKEAGFCNAESGNER